MTDEKKDKGGKIADLGHERRKREKKPSKVSLYRIMSDYMNHEPFARLFQDFPETFHVVEPVLGVRLILQEKDQGVVQYVDKDAVVNAIIRYTQTQLAGNELYAWDVEEAGKAMRFWKALAHPMPEPPAVRWLDDPGLCFRRLPWIFQEGGGPKDCPTFAELFSRISNGPALRDWIGSLFDPSVRPQQYVWLYGQGGNGKGSLARFLHKVLGRVVVNKNPPPPNCEARWAAGIIGARLVVFPDCNHASFPASGFFKTLTGGDPIDIDPKFEKPFTAELNAMFMFLSNERPKLSSQKADMRRAIFCDFADTGRPEDPHYEQKLWAEGGAFLSYCIESYRTGYPNGGVIRADMTDLEEYVGVVEEPYEVFFEQHFALEPHSSVSPQQMQEALCDRFKSSREHGEFLKWMERRHGVRKRSVKIDQKVIKRYPGIRALSNFEQANSDG